MVAKHLLLALLIKWLRECELSWKWVLYQKTVTELSCVETLGYMLKIH